MWKILLRYGLPLILSIFLWEASNSFIVDKWNRMWGNDTAEVAEIKKQLAEAEMKTATAEAVLEAERKKIAEAQALTEKIKASAIKERDYARAMMRNYREMKKENEKFKQAIDSEHVIPIDALLVRPETKPTTSN